jgi:hypothetical protein
LAVTFSSANNVNVARRIERLSSPENASQAVLPASHLDGKEADSPGPTSQASV